MLFQNLQTQIFYVITNIHTSKGIFVEVYIKQVNVSVKNVKEKQSIGFCFNSLEIWAFSPN